MIINDQVADQHCIGSQQANLLAWAKNKPLPKTHILNQDLKYRQVLCTIDYFDHLERQGQLFLCPYCCHGYKKQLFQQHCQAKLKVLVSNIDIEQVPPQFKPAAVSLLDYSWGDLSFLDAQQHSQDSTHLRNSKKNQQKSISDQSRLNLSLNYKYRPPKQPAVKTVLAQKPESLELKEPVEKALHIPQGQAQFQQIKIKSVKLKPKASIKKFEGLRLDLDQYDQHQHKPLVFQATKIPKILLSPQHTQSIILQQAQRPAKKLLKHFHKQQKSKDSDSHRSSFLRVNQYNDQQKQTQEGILIGTAAVDKFGNHFNCVKNHPILFPILIDKQAIVALNVFRNSSSNLEEPLVEILHSIDSSLQGLYFASGRQTFIIPQIPIDFQFHPKASAMLAVTPIHYQVKTKFAAFPAKPNWEKQIAVVKMQKTLSCQIESFEFYSRGESVLVKKQGKQMGIIQTNFCSVSQFQIKQINAQSCQVRSQAFQFQIQFGKDFFILKRNNFAVQLHQQEATLLAPHQLHISASALVINRMNISKNNYRFKEIKIFSEGVKVDGQYTILINQHGLFVKKKCKFILVGYGDSGFQVQGQQGTYFTKEENFLKAMDERRVFERVGAVAGELQIENLRLGYEIRKERYVIWQMDL